MLEAENYKAFSVEFKNRMHYFASLNYTDR